MGLSHYLSQSSSISLDAVVALAVVFFLLWVTGTVFYRLSLHPLARFPGPKLAAATHWYEFYYDVLRDGQFTFRLRELHKRYGPVVRINPDELHFHDPEYFDEIYNYSARVDKPPREAVVFGPFDTTLATMGHEQHRIRRAALNPFFSKRSISRFVPTIIDIVEQLCDRLEEFSRTGEPLKLAHPYVALATDVVHEYCFSRSPHDLLKPDFNRDFTDDAVGTLTIPIYQYHMPWLIGSVLKFPEWLQRKFSPGMARVFDILQSIGDQVESIRSGKDRNHEDSRHTTVLHALIHSKLPPQDSTIEHLREEAFSLIGAGTFTTSHALQITTYHIMANPDVRKRLFEELKGVMPDRLDRPPSLETLEQLPYLSAVLHEGLRLSDGTVHRHMRSFPDKALRYGEFVVPPGTSVGMTSFLIHQDKAVFTEPMTFRPERWLMGEGGEAVPARSRLQRYFSPFNRGNRSCVGFTLAWAELYLTIAMVMRRFDIDVSQVVRERDIDCVRACVNPLPSKESKGIWVKVLPGPE